MVKIALQISATLENVEELKTCHPDYSFFLKFKCSNCGESTNTWHDLMESERVAQDSRNAEGFNFYAKCKLCSRENSVDVIPGTNATYSAEDSGKLKTLVQFDCRGLEPVGFLPKSGWIVKSADGGPTFDDVDLSEDDWVEYDTKNDVPVGVSEFKSDFIKLKK